MHKKYLLFIWLLLLIHFISWSQKIENKPYTTIVENCKMLDKALVQRDTLTLNRLLHTGLSFGHSNGWLEKKTDLLRILKTEKVSYLTIDQVGTVVIQYQKKDLLSTRRDLDVTGLLEGKSFDSKLHALEVWIKERGKWQLLARQSVKRKE
jgi:hypothetical protein